MILRTKLLTGFIIIIIILSTVGIINMKLSDQVRKITDNIMINYEVLGKLNNFAIGMYDEHDLAVTFIISGDPEIKEEKEVMCEMNYLLLEELNEIVPGDINYHNQFSIILNIFNEMDECFMNFSEDIDNASEQEKFDEIIILDGFVQAILVGTDKGDELGMDFISETIYYENGESIKSMEILKTNSRTNSFLGLFLAVAAAIVLGIYISNSIGNRVKKLKDATTEIASGNLEVFIDAKGDDEIMELSASFNNMASNLKKEIYSRTVAEADLRKKSDQLVRTNIELREYAYVTAHDLKTPLVTIQGFTELLEQRIGNKLDEKSGQYLTRISGSANRLNTLINDLLVLSTVETEKLPYERANIVMMLESVISRYKKEIDARGIEIRYPDYISTIFCDAARIEQVFSILIENSVKYSSDTGKPLIEIGFEDKPNDWMFWVKDNGPGIRKTEQERIFKPFEKDREDIEGTGIGLAIAKKIVNIHGGKIRVESEIGEGAIFYFTLPKNG